MIKFGPSGNSNAFYDKGHSKSTESATWVKEMGLDCFEYSFGRGVKMTDEKALEIGMAFKNAGVEISVHAPYYINFANESEESASNSYNYVLDSARKCLLMGGNRIVFHPASQGKLSREYAVELTEKRLKILRDKIYENGLDNLMYCPETMGKLGQIGTIEEIVRFCKIDKIYVPTVDFGHVNAREQGSLNTKEDYEERLKFMIDELGYEKMKNFHVHFSKIEYSSKGEVRHLTFSDNVFGPDFSPLSEALKTLNLTPYIVCESNGTQDIDALAMKKIYLET